ncbi:MAG: hypothetical protein ACF8SC_06860 [Phycisphaerales bacterium JB037]
MQQFAALVVTSSASMTICLAQDKLPSYRVDYHEIEPSGPFTLPDPGARGSADQSDLRVKREASRGNPGVADLRKMPSRRCEHAKRFLKGYFARFGLSAYYESTVSSFSCDLLVLMAENRGFDTELGYSRPEPSWGATVSVGLEFKGIGFPRGPSLTSFGKIRYSMARLFGPTGPSVPLVPVEFGGETQGHSHRRQGAATPMSRSRDVNPTLPDSYGAESGLGYDRPVDFGTDVDDVINGIFDAAMRDYQRIVEDPGHLFAPALEEFRPVEEGGVHGDEEGRIRGMLQQRVQEFEQRFRSPDSAREREIKQVADSLAKNGEPREVAEVIASILVDARRAAMSDLSSPAPGRPGVYQFPPANGANQTGSQVDSAGDAR